MPTNETFSQRRRVLVADDDPIFLELSLRVLSQAGFDVAQAEDGAQAMTILQESYFDLSIIDLSMPRIDGLRLIALIRATPRLRTLPVLVITSKTDPSAIEEGYKVGANDYLTKPVVWQQLPARVGHLIDRSRGDSSAREDELQTQSIAY